MSETGANDDAAASPRPSTRRRVGGALRHPIVSGLIVTVIGSVIVGVLLNRSSSGGGDDTPSTPEDPLAISAQPNDDAIEEGWTMAVAGALPADPPPDTGCPSGREWMLDAGAQDVGVTRLKVLLQGTGTSTVAVTGARAEVTPIALDDIDQTEVECPPAGEEPVVTMGFDLDADEPRALESDGFTAGETNYFSEQSLSVGPGENVPLSVNVFSQECNCEWHLVFEVTVDGEQSEIVVDDGGQPFVTLGSAVDPVASYGWGVACGGSVGPAPCRL